VSAFVVFVCPIGCVPPSPATTPPSAPFALASSSAFFFCAFSIFHAAFFSASLALTMTT